jgi:thiol-disulfide isomerase/thioredoxin
VRLVGKDFAGADLDTGTWVGDVVVINTWYAACPPCRAEAPDLVAVAQDYAARGVHFIGVNGTDDGGAAQAFERNFKIPYSSIHDSGGSAIAALQGRVPVEAVPTTVVLDRQGRVTGRILGRLDPATLRALIDTALAEAP